MKNTISLVSFVFVLLAASSAAAQETAAYRVVVHPTNPMSSVSRSVAAKLFLKKTSKWEHGQKAQPVDLSASSSTRAAFSKGVLGKSVSSVKSYWQQKIFSGRGVPPPEKSSDAKVVAYVLSHAGAIGYVSSRADVSRVKVVSVR